MKNISTFGKAMAQVMKGRMAFHGVTQAEMAEAIQLSQSQLSKILGPRELLISNLSKHSAKHWMKMQQISLKPGSR